MLGCPPHIQHHVQWRQQTWFLLTNHPGVVNPCYLPLAVAALAQPWPKPFKPGEFASTQQLWDRAADRWLGSLLNRASGDGSSDRLWLFHWSSD